jgi:hypothetical protein
VLLVNLPLAVVCVIVALRSVPADEPIGDDERHVDVSGTILLTTALVGLVYRLTQVQSKDLVSVAVVGPLAVSAVAGLAFVAGSGGRATR